MGLIEGEEERMPLTDILQIINFYHTSPFPFGTNLTFTRMAAIFYLANMTSMTAPRRLQIDGRTL